MNNSRIKVKFIVYELNTWSKNLNVDFTLQDCLFGAVKLTTNADADKYFYSAYGVGFDSCLLFLLTNFDWGKYSITFVEDDSSSLHIDDHKKDILDLGE